MSFYTFLPKILNMSLTASVAIVFVLLLRLLLKKAPKVISYALWGVVLLRLLCPVSIESGLSLYGLLDTPTVDMTEHSSAMEYIPSNIVHTEYPEVVLPVPGVGEAITETLPQGEEQLRADPLEGPIFIATYVWMGGILVMAVYGIVTYLRLRRRLITASPLRNNIYLADEIESPFVMGLVRPKIYLPSAMKEREQSYIILHEQHHIRRLDHIVKALAFVALCIHWFNPLVWVAFILSGKDMEMSCDEAVVRKLGTQIRADYTASLLSLATGKRIIAGMPLAFGEGNTKDRIKNLANWKKPAFWVVLVAVVACVALAVCLLTNPTDSEEPDLSFLNYKNAVNLVIEQDEVMAIYCPTSDESGSQIQVGAADGKELAKYLNQWDWNECSAPRNSLASPGSVEFVIDDEYRITVYQKKSGALRQYAVVKVQEDVRYYSTDRNDYADAVALVHAPAKSDEGSVAGKTYVYENEGIMGSFAITLYEDGTFTYYEGMASSYIGVGSWEQDGDTITLTDDGHGGYGLVNHFRRNGDDLVFVEQDSDNFVYVKVKDGERFHCTGEAFKQNNGAEEDGSNQTLDVSIQDTFFTYDGIQYDLAERNGTINEITDYFQIGERLVLEGHTGPKHNIYCVFNTSTQSFETDFAGANLTWYGDNINTVVYSYWSDVFTYDGRCLASYELPENEYIYSLDYAEDGSQIEAVIISDTGNERTENISPNTYVIAYSDLNHNRVNEQVVLRTVAPGQLYELAVTENGVEIWKTEAGLPHVGWNTIMLYSEGGQDYLVQYLPTMYQGIGSYTCTVFSLEGNKQTVKEEWSIDEFKLEAGDPPAVTKTPEMERFAEAVDLILRNSGVLLSTEQGVLVDRYTPASALPQIYPVRFSPDEIRQAMEAAANPTAPQELTANAAAFPTEALEFVFASGAGAWGTYLTLQPNGHFTGDYGDSDMDTRYECKFEGRFIDIQQISDYCWGMKLGDVTMEKEEGTTWTEDGIHYIASGPYGVSDGTDFLLYTPGTPADLLLAACRDWWPDAYRWRNGEIDSLNGWALYNLDAGHGFFTSWLS